MIVFFFVMCLFASVVGTEVPLLSLKKDDSTPDIFSTLLTPKTHLNISTDDDKKEKSPNGGTVFPPRAVRRAGALSFLFFFLFLFSLFASSFFIRLQFQFYDSYFSKFQ